MRVPSNTGSKFPTQKPAIDKVAEHIDAVVTVATSIESGQFDKVSVPEVGTVAGISKQVVAVAEVEQYVRMLALDLSNVDKVAEELGGVLNVSNNMATVLLLHSRMADLLNIQKSLVHIDAVALNEERINSVYEIIPEIATLVSHMGSLVRIADMEPQLNAVFQNLDAIFLIGSNMGHIVNVSANMEAILEASTYVAEIYTLIEQIKGIEAHIVGLEASSKVNAEEAAKQALEAKAQMVEATTQAGMSTTQANAANGSAIQAAESATFADASQKKATTSESNAKVSETNAANSAAAALASKNAAKASEDNAKLYEADARASMTAAAVSATTAGTNANLATAEANKAKDYASDALTSKNAAASSATTASTGATTATTKAAEASSSASAAKTSQDAAKASETSAADSKDRAATSATTATNKATEAAASEATAKSKATEADSSATSAAASKNAAASSATTASNGASTATTKASEAATSATNAAASAATATTKASEAAASAASAANSAASASAAVLDAERRSLERATGGSQTIIRDSAGNANAMFVLPRFTYADLGMTANMGTGNVTAFDFGSGSIKGEIFIGAYLASGSGAVSAPRQDPRASLDHTAARNACSAKGAGWHLMTAHEWAAIALWCMVNGYEPIGNTNWGRSHAQTRMVGDRADNRAPGDASGTGRTQTGSMGVEATHNKSLAGIADLVGNVWEWQDGLLLQDGRFKISAYNTQAEVDWAFVDAYLDASSTAGGSAILSSAITNRLGALGDNANAGNSANVDWRSMTKAGGYVSLQALRRLLVEPASVLPQGRIYMRNFGERLPSRGGSWGEGADAGLAALRLAGSRVDTYTVIGFRPAFA